MKCLTEQVVADAALQVLLAIAAFLVFPTMLPAASYSTTNFVVSADSLHDAQAIAETAELLRSRLALEWLGGEIPAGRPQCRIVVESGHPDSSGWTSFQLFQGSPEDVRIILRGPLDEILSNVLPHEICHVVIAGSIGRIIPRWADEGIAMMAEHAAVRDQQRRYAGELLQARRLCSLQDILECDEYPRERQELRQFYAGSLTLIEFLVEAHGRQRLTQFLRDGSDRDWETAMQTHYQFDSVASLEAAWRKWLITSLEAHASDSRSGALPVAAAHSR